MATVPTSKSAVALAVYMMVPFWGTARGGHTGTMAVEKFRSSQIFTHTCTLYEKSSYSTIKAEVAECVHEREDTEV